MGSAAALPSLLLCILHLTAGASAEPRYMVVFPSVLYYPNPGKVHVHLMDLEEPVRVTLHLASSHGIPNVTLEEQGNGTLQLNWPRFSNISTPPAGINEVARVHVSIQGGSLQVSEQWNVLVKSLELGILVQTDKKLYKPGQTVKFRIVCLDQNFIPSNMELPLVAVQDPSGNNLVQWQKVRPRQGIVDLSFPLAADLTMDTYTIKVMEKYHFFRVDKYRLPRFEVLIHVPLVGTLKDTIPLDVCGRYPSGKPFWGRAEVLLCHDVFPMQPLEVCVEFRGQTGRNGCFFTEVPAASFNLTGWYKAYLCARVLLLEEGTHEHSHANNHLVMPWHGGNSKKWQKATEICTSVYVMARITIETTEQFYSPGIPLTGTMMLRGANSSALKGKEFLLVVNTGGETQRKTLVMDGLGRASFELDTSGWTNEVSLHGELKDDPPASEHEGKKHLNYQSVRHYIYPVSLNSNSFLMIRRVKKKLPCGQTQKVWVDYVFDEKAMGTKLQSVDVVFLVLAKGTVITTLRKEVPAAAGLRGSFYLELPIGPELMPKAKVVGYVVLPNGETVTDSIELNLANCFPNKVNLSFSEQRALVGSQIHLKVQAAPGSLCALYAMDQAKRSSGLKNKIKPSMVFHLFPMFYEDRYPFENSDSNCDSFTIARLPAPSINCFDMPGNSWKDCISYRRRWYREAPPPTLQTDFMLKNRDLKVVTNTQLGCRSSFQVERSSFSEGEEGEEDEQPVVIQNTEMVMDFLGTWLWELVPVGEGGSTEMVVTVPDAITEWKAGMFCMSPLGLGMAPETTLTTFKPFLVDLALPYTVVRHEAFTLVATVFNYLRQCLWVQVKLVESEKLEVLADMDKEAYKSCVCADEERTFQWNMQATRLGKVNVTVIARALHTEKPCGTEVPVVPDHEWVDTKTKRLRVQLSKQR